MLTDRLSPCCKQVQKNVNEINEVSGPGDYLPNSPLTALPTPSAALPAASTPF